MPHVTHHRFVHHEPVVYDQGMTNTDTKRTGRIWTSYTLNAPVEILSNDGDRYRVRTLPGGTGGWSEPGRELMVSLAMLTFNDQPATAIPAAEAVDTEITGPIAAEDYITVLVARQSAWRSRNPQVTLPPLLEWFIREGDEAHVILPNHEAQPKRVRTPRVYRTAASLREERDRIQARMDQVAGTDPSGGDNAVVNLSPNSRSKAARTAGRRRFAQNDRALATFTALRKRRDALASQIARADAREARAAAQAG